MSEPEAYLPLFLLFCNLRPVPNLNTKHDGSSQTEQTVKLRLIVIMIYMHS